MDNFLAIRGRSGHKKPKEQIRLTLFNAPSDSKESELWNMSVPRSQ